MKGLLYKEWATLTSSYKQSVFFFAFLYGGISILTGQTGMAYGLLVIFSILITSTISFDENSHWDIYVRTLPVTPAQLVGSKYLFGLVASVSPDLMQLFNASDEVLLTGLVAAFVGLLAVYFVSYKVCVGIYRRKEY